MKNSSNVQQFRFRFRPGRSTAHLRLLLVALQVIYVKLQLPFVCWLPVELKFTANDNFRIFSCRQTLFRHSVGVSVSVCVWNVIKLENSFRIKTITYVAATLYYSVLRARRTLLNARCSMVGTRGSPVEIHKTIKLRLKTLECIIWF